MNEYRTNSRGRRYVVRELYLYGNTLFDSPQYGKPGFVGVYYTSKYLDETPNYGKFSLKQEKTVVGDLTKAEQDEHDRVKRIQYIYDVTVTSDLPVGMV